MKSIQRANVSMKKDLAFHKKNAKKIAIESERLSKNVKELTTSLSISELNNDAICKRNAKQTKMNRHLREKNLDLEQTLCRTISEVKKDHLSLVIENTETQANQARDLDATTYALRMAQEELTRIRKYATVLLKQRTECEQFFHEALDQVKEEKRRRNEIEYKKQTELWKKSLTDHGIDGHPTKFMLKKGQRGKSSALVIRKPVPSEDITLSDLTLDEREHVLKVLLTKMNNVEEERLADMSSELETLNSKYKPGSTFITEQSF